MIELYPIEVKYKKLSKPIMAKVLIDFYKELKSVKGRVVNLNYNFQGKYVDYVDYRNFLTFGFRGLK